MIATRIVTDPSLSQGALPVPAPAQTCRRQTSGRPPRPRRVPDLVVAVAAAVMLVVTAGCSGSAAAAPTRAAYTFPRDPVNSFVTTQGTHFMVGGSPYRFVGVNIYDAAATDRYSCDPANRMTNAELQTTLRTLHDTDGATVVRFWAYQTYTDSGQDYTGMDQVIAAAKSVGMRVLPVLEDGPGYCTTSSSAVPKAQYRNDTWFTDGYKVPYGTAKLSFRDYARFVADHYKNEPDILGWSLINEADTSARDATGQSVLINFAKDVATEVRSVDPNHLITLGTQSNGARGASGPDFTAVYSLPELDFAEVHDWGYWGEDTAAMYGGTNGTPPAPNSPKCQTLNAPIGCSFARLSTLDKPLFVGEAGMTGQNTQERADRATRLDAKMKAAFAAGAGGYLLWRVTKTATDKYDITLNDNDPLLTVTANIAQSLR